MPTYKLLKSTHPEYDAEYWRKIRALYAGGRRLLVDAFKDKHLLEKLFPRHLGEDDSIYVERQKRAFYIPYMGQLIDYIVSVLGSDPVTLNAEEAGEDLAPGSIEDYYDDFMKNTARPGTEKVSLNQLLRVQMLNALLTKRAWTLVDFPRVPVGADGNPVKPASRKEEEDLGLDQAYCVPLEPEQVLDWQEDDDGELEWALVARASVRRAGVGAARNLKREEFTEYTRDGWTRFIYEYDPEKQPGRGGPPTEDQEPDRIESGKHTFERVPLIPLPLPEGLWAGSKLESIAVQHFNARCALSWGQIRSLFQILVAKLAAPDPLNPISEDTDRALNQPIGPGRVVQLSEKDSFGWAGPDAAPFREAREDLASLKDEMFRVLQQMAMAVDSGSSTKKQSGDSKVMDYASSITLAKELGRRLREHAEDIFDMVARGRKDPERVWVARGAEEFDDINLDSFVQEAATLETVSVPSPTFQALYKYELARRLIPGATDEQLQTIWGELQTGITAESMVTEATQSATIATAEATAADPTAAVADKGAEKGKPEGGDAQGRSASERRGEPARVRKKPVKKVPPRTLRREKSKS